MSDNWVVQNLQNALGTWNDKLAEVWQLMTMSPENFKGGGIWNVILNINGAMQAIGLALLVLFFLAGVVQTSANLTDVKRPEHALKLFLRFAIAKGVVTYGLELMMAVFEIVQGIISKIMRTSGPVPYTHLWVKRKRPFSPLYLIMTPVSIFWCRFCIRSFSSSSLKLQIRSMVEACRYTFTSLWTSLLTSHYLTILTRYSL